MEKIIRLSIENTTKIRQVEDSFCELYSHDKNNGAFEFEISKGSLTNENVVALFKFLRSGSYWKTNGTVEDNKIKFNFDTSLITQNEEVVCYIYLDKEERNSDIFRFRFKVNLSEIDKASQLPVKERFFANSMIVDRVDVLTKEDFEKALVEISKGSHFLTENQANEKYALKGDIPNVSNLVSSTQLSDYALKTEIPNSETIVNKAVEEVGKKGYLTEHQSLAGYVTETQLNDKGYLTQHQDISKLATKKSVDDVEAKVTQLENKPSYDDSEIKREIKELKDRPVTANIDTSNFVTTTQLEDKHYLTEHQDISKLATKEQLDELKNSQPTVDNLVTKEQLRKAFLNEEGQEKYVDLDTFVSATRGVLGSSTNEKGVEEYFNEVTTGLSEDAKETYIGDIYKNATETKVYRKNGFTNFKDMMYALAKVFPDNYNYKDENQVVNILTNKNYQDYIKSTGSGELRGHGFPTDNTAPIGTTYIDEDVTNGALKWIKTKTVWKAIEGDTGWVDIPISRFVSQSKMQVRRINNIVHVRFSSDRDSGLIQISDYYTITPPYLILFKTENSLGWRPSQKIIQPILPEVDSSNSQYTYDSSQSPHPYLRLNPQFGGMNIELSIDEFTVRNTGFGVYINSFSYLTEDGWPNSLAIR